MDRVTLKVLEAEIEAQLEQIDQVYCELDDRAGQMQPLLKRDVAQFLNQLGIDYAD